MKSNVSQLLTSLVAMRTIFGLSLLAPPPWLVI